jgi:hypothetical protein
MNKGRLVDMLLQCDISLLLIDILSNTYSYPYAVDLCQYDKTYSSHHVHVYTFDITYSSLNVNVCRCRVFGTGLHIYLTGCIDLEITQIVLYCKTRSLEQLRYA